MNKIEKYQDSLSAIPVPGGGGCHPYLLRVANIGVRAGISEKAIFDDISDEIPSGRRRVPDAEITAAIRKAAGDHGGALLTPINRNPLKQFDGPAARRRIIKQGTTDNEADLWGLSPVRIDWHPCEDSWRFLSAMFTPDEDLFIGDRHEAGLVGKNIRAVSDWIRFFQNGGTAGPFIIINPLTGEFAPTKSGDRMTYRGDGCIAIHRYALAEFDTLTHEEQIAFWTGAKLPVEALIDSGGKSIHAWLKVDIDDPYTWERKIREKLYRQALIPMGIDSACSNAARLARLPGCLRGERWQKILYIGGTL